MSEILKNENYITKKYNGIEFRSAWDGGSIENTISYIVMGKSFIVDFDELKNKKDFNDIILYHLFANNFLLEYDLEIERDKNKILFQEKFQPIEKSFNSVEQSDGSQVPQYYGEFEYKGKFYLITIAVNRISDSDETNPEKGVYKGVIVNPDLYFGETNKEVGLIKGKLDYIIL